MNIAFTGTHLTGKTTLLNDFSKHIASVGEDSHLHGCSFDYITGIARRIIKRGFPLNKDGNVYSYINYINDQLEEEKRMITDIFISDRTILSALAYATTNKELPRPFIPDYLIQMIENVWLLEKQRYDLYLYFPIEFPMTGADRVHPADDEYRKKIDVTIHRFLEQYNVHHIHISGSQEERLDTLVSIIPGKIK